MNAHDLDTVARTLYGEARGQGWAGLVAVGWCIRNRVEIDLRDDNKPDWWGEGYVNVCLKPWQFSCWNANDPNRKKLMAVETDDAAFRECIAAAAAVMTGLEPDPTERSHHYHTASIKPSWSRGFEPVTRIGDHVFYNDMRVP